MSLRNDLFPVFWIPEARLKPDFHPKIENSKKNYGFAALRKTRGYLGSR